MIIKRVEEPFITNERNPRKRAPALTRSLHCKMNQTLYDARAFDYTDTHIYTYTIIKSWYIENIRAYTEAESIRFTQEKYWKTQLQRALFFYNRKLPRTEKREHPSGKSIFAPAPHNCVVYA